MSRIGPGAQTFVNAKVFTGRGEGDFASAFRIEAGRFTWVGDAAEVDPRGAVDLGGRTVLPGFIDSHTHPALMIGHGTTVECFPPAVTSIQALQGALRDHPAYGGGDAEWILGRGFDETKYPGQRMPTASDLDAAGEPGLPTKVALYPGRDAAALLAELAWRRLHDEA